MVCAVWQSAISNAFQLRNLQVTVG